MIYFFGLKSGKTLLVEIDKSLFELNEQKSDGKKAILVDKLDYGDALSDSDKIEYSLVKVNTISVDFYAIETIEPYTPNKEVYGKEVKE